MKSLVFVWFSAIWLLTSLSSDAALITSEDFEGGASGWSNNTTTAGNANFTRFLGRFQGVGHGGGGTQQLWKTFSLSGHQTLVEIQFDFYEIDSWDARVHFEAFQVFVDDALVSSILYDHSRRDVPGGIVSNLLPVSGNANLGFLPNFQDQSYRYAFPISTTGTTLKLGFGATIEQNDESWGIDNVIITDNAPVSPIPEPSTLVVFSFALVATVAYRSVTRLRRGN